jgi:hypothetical protein
MAIEWKTDKQKENEQKINEIQNELNNLDKEISRSAENLYEQGIYTNISSREKEAINKKVVLRKELKELTK